MHKLKQIPEDFRVKEVTNREFGEEGSYLVCIMKKNNYNTEDAVQAICNALRVQRKNIGYAGTKDRNAITSQYISIYKGTPERIAILEFEDIQLEPVGRTATPISLGDLEGNEFDITIRNLDKEEIKKMNKFPNYFDKQRFSKNNLEIGRAIIKKDFKKATEILLQDNKYGERIKKILEKSKNNHSTALRSMPQKIIMIFIHAYQSYIWNETLSQLGEQAPEEIPLIGFGTELDETETSLAIKKILEKEEITQRDFIIREIPELSPEGTTRKSYADLKDLKISEKEEDELNPGKKKVKVSFFLEKGAYATMAVKNLLD